MQPERRKFWALLSNGITNKGAIWQRHLNLVNSNHYDSYSGFVDVLKFN